VKGKIMKGYRTTRDTEKKKEDRKGNGNSFIDRKETPSLRINRTIRLIILSSDAFRALTSGLA
jgi:hypothetical protein